MIKSKLAGAIVNPCRFVVQGATYDKAIQASAVTSKIIGVSAPDIVVALGRTVDINMLGEIAPIELGGTVTFGDHLTSDSVGRGIELSSTILAASSARSGGIVLQSGVVGDIVPMVVIPQLVSVFDGVTATVDEIDAIASMPVAADFTIGTEADDAINVAIQLNDANGDACAVRRALYAYLSDDANGDSIVATAPDGGVAIGTDGLADPVTANKSFMLTSEADGDIDITITHAGGAKTCYLILVMPTGALVASGAITFAA